MTVSSKKYSPINPLEDIPHHTATPGKLTVFSSTMFGFSLAQYTQLWWLIVPLSLNVASPDQTIESWKSSLRHTCAGTTYKIAVTYLGRPHLVRGHVFPFLSSKNFLNIGLLNTNLTRTLPQWLLWGSCKNQHDCISTLVINGTSLYTAPTFQHSLHCSIDFKLVSDSCYCYSCW